MLATWQAAVIVLLLAVCVCQSVWPLEVRSAISSSSSCMHVHTCTVIPSLVTELKTVNVDEALHDSM